MQVEHITLKNPGKDSAILGNNKIAQRKETPYLISVSVSLCLWVCRIKQYATPLHGVWRSDANSLGEFWLLETI